MVVDITAGDVTAQVRNNAGTIEALNGSVAVQTCSPDTPTTANVNSITINDNVAGQNSLFLLDLSSGALAPGTPAEGSGTSEIEVTVNAGDGLVDRLQVIGTATSDTYRFGALSATAIGANLNEDDDSDDVTVNNGERLTVSSFAGADTLDASGGAGFTGPIPYNNPGSAAVILRGGTENDVLKSGAGSSFIDGGTEDDTMTGGAGGDEIEFGSGGGNDVGDGGGGIDFANFQFSPAGQVSVDLRITDPQDTGDAGTDTLTNFEGLVGSQNPAGIDTLIGTNGPNQIFANAGDDTLIGLGGDDTLSGNAGNDTVSYAEASTGAITLSLAITTTQVTGGAGNDTLPDVNPSDGVPDIENVVGSPFGGDLLTGNGLANQIDAYDGLADTVDCAGDADIAIADEVGVDTLSNCETTDNAPQTSIASGPADGGTVSTSTPTYELSADEPSNFQLQVDAGSFQACSASCTLPALTNGTHAVAFRAMDQDENGHADLTPATRSVTVNVQSAPVPTDTTAPETTIGSHPKSKTRKRTATFTFSASEPGATFLCSYDGKPFAPCTSLFTIPKLKRGKHHFDVLAVDSAGNRDASAATFLWKIVKRKRR